MLNRSRVIEPLNPIDRSSQQEMFSFQDPEGPDCCVSAAAMDSLSRLFDRRIDRLALLPILGI